MCVCVCVSGKQRRVFILPVFVELEEEEKRRGTTKGAAMRSESRQQEIEEGWKTGGGGVRGRGEREIGNESEPSDARQHGNVSASPAPV